MLRPSDVKVFVSVNGSLQFAFFARSGVLTGCPLSASLFVIAINPFLLDFQRSIVKHSYGVLYACADDLGSALLQIASLNALHRIFKVMAVVSNMVLHIKKCVIIPLVPPDSQYFSQYSMWLQQHLPDWSEFKIATHAEYLGFEVGPTAGSCQFDKVFASFKHHLSTIVSSGAPPSVSVFSYNTRLLPKFSYKA